MLNERYTIPIKAVKNMYAALADVNAHQPYDVEVYKYSKGLGVKIYHINYYNEKDDLIQPHHLLCSFPFVYDHIDYQWINNNTLIVWFCALPSIDEMKFRLTGDDITPQVEREY